MTVELSFAKILKYLRITKRMSQEELACRSNLGQTYISMLERSIHKPTITTLFALSKALNIKASEMIKLVEIDYEKINEEEY